MPAPKGNQNAKGNKGGGRPTDYKPEYSEQVVRLCLLGATNDDLAAFFHVHADTINEWRKNNVEFSRALKEGKIVADTKIGESLFQRASGYSHEAEKIMIIDGSPEIVKYTERYPPDTTALIFWLKNRRPDLWRDKTEQAHSLDPDTLEVFRIAGQTITFK